MTMTNSPKYWLVYVSGKELPKKRHTICGTAIEEARRLAAKHPETDVVVMEATHTFRGTITVARVGDLFT